MRERAKYEKRGYKDHRERVIILSLTRVISFPAFGLHEDGFLLLPQLVHPFISVLKCPLPVLLPHQQPDIDDAVPFDDALQTGPAGDAGPPHDAGISLEEGLDKPLREYE